MPYQANRDCTISKLIATGKDVDGSDKGIYESVNYAAGAVIYEVDVAPHIQRRLANGDDHLSTLLKVIDEDEAREILASQASEAGLETVEQELLHQEERSGPTAVPDGPTVQAPYEKQEPHEGEENGETEATEAQETEGQAEGDQDQTEGQPDVEGEQAEAPQDTEPEPDAVNTSDEVAPAGEAEEADSKEPDDADESAQESSDEQAEEETDADGAPNFDEMSKRDLSRYAKENELEIEGRSKMDVEELRNAVKESVAAQG